MKQNLFYGVIKSPEADELQQAWDDLWKSANQLIKNLKKKTKNKKESLRRA